MRKLAIFTLVMTMLASPALAWTHGRAPLPPLPITPPGAPKLTCDDFQHYPDKSWTAKHPVVVGLKDPGTTLPVDLHFSASDKFSGVDVGKVLNEDCLPHGPA